MDEGDAVDDGSSGGKRRRSSSKGVKRKARDAFKQTRRERVRREYVPLHACYVLAYDDSRVQIQREIKRRNLAPFDAELLELQDSAGGVLEPGKFCAMVMRAS